MRATPSQDAAPSSAGSTDEGRLNILRDRARQLAYEGEAVDNREKIEVIVFRLMAESYAVEARFVREVYSLKNLTRIPCVPAFFLGVVNVRGELCPVVELRRLFGLAEAGLTNASRMIIIRNAVMEVGIVADHIVGMRHIEEADLLPAPLTLAGGNAALLRGVTKMHLAVLDAERILAHPGLVVNEQVDV